MECGGRRARKGGSAAAKALIRLSDLLLLNNLNSVLEHMTFEWPTAVRTCFILAW
jgi:hypothetical protein